MFDSNLPLADDERKLIRAKAKRLAGYDVTSIVFLCAIGATAVIGVWYVGASIWVGVVGFATIGFAGLIVFRRMRSIARHARHLVREQGIDVCERCGYWMRESPSRCSECGWEP